MDENLRLVYSLAVKLYRQLGRRVELDDLVALGTEGLIQAADRFDTARGLAFSTFACYRIRGAMLDGLRRFGLVSGRSFASGHRCYSCGTSGMLEQNHEVASAVERCDAADDDPCASSRIGAALAALPASERAIIEQHYFGGHSLMAAGSALGFSKSWASRLHARALDSLRSSLQDLAA
ncbi:MAG TPA: sigma-70 family RNA polymerase sigma factor [Kofleriaceae bacterium]|nr:sigma-70 family RNA polymerase sigma factor [Kofleriaceae bacterium]